MNVEFRCNELPIENVAEFKYLGLIINRANTSPATILEKRICKAVAAFNNIKCHTRLLGLINRRVRV
jgi:hypothetical protein